MLHKVLLTSKSVHEIPKFHQFKCIKAIQEYFPVECFVYKVVLAFELLEEILKCNRSNESY